MQWGHRERLGGVVDRRRIGKGAYGVTRDRRVHHSTRLVATEWNARGVDGNSVRGKRVEFRFGNDVGMRRENANSCLPPPVKLPHGRPFDLKVRRSPYTVRRLGSVRGKL